MATALAATVAIGIVVAVVLVSLRGPLAEWLFGDDRYETAVTIAAVALPVTALASLLRQVMRLRFKPWQFLTSALVGAVIATAISLTAVLAFDRGVEGVFIGTLCGGALSLVYGAIINAPFIGRSFSRPELRTMLAYGMPLIPAALAMWALQFVDRIMLSKLATLSDVGQYAVGEPRDDAAAPARDRFRHRLRAVDALDARRGRRGREAGARADPHLLRGGPGGRRRGAEPVRARGRASAGAALRGCL